jgi:hypothetical protein
MGKRVTKGRWQRLEPRVVFFACHAFIEGRNADWIARELREHFNEPMHRTQVYSLLEEGRKRGYFHPTPPDEIRLAERMMDLFVRQPTSSGVRDASSEAATATGGRGQPQARTDSRKIRVVSHGFVPSLENVAAAAAETAEKVITGLYETRYARLRRKPPSRHEHTADPTLPAVHVGIGAGSTTQRVTRYLAERVRSLDVRPHLVLHALSSGFNVQQPTTAPVAFFSYFDGMPEVEFRGLFSSGYATREEWHTMRRNVGVRESFACRDEIDVIITSLATVDDPHGELNRFMALNTDFGPEVRKILDETEKREGDVMYRPFSKTRPITREVAIRAVTLFELEELVAFAKRADHTVILVAGPCAECKKMRTRALLPLLREPSLAVWTHVVTDDLTAEECIMDAERAAE